jgi:DNA-directed RNA polymerase specialized sigma24 family protein
MPGLPSDAAPLLRAFLDGDEQVSTETLDILVRIEAVPVIRAIVLSRVGRDTDVDDVVNDVVVQITKRLRAARAARETEPISSFHAYVATAAYRACDGVLRDKYPERHRLHHRVRYVVSHHEAFFSDGPRCGLAGTRERASGAAASFPAVGDADLRGERLVATLIRLFRAAGGPLPLDAVIALLAPAAAAPPPDAAPEEVADGRAGIVVTLVYKAQLQELWEEVRLLPRAQRIALLFHLRDANGDELLSMLSGIGVASAAEIAHALELAEPELAAIRDGLPWGDGRISELLGVTRQQVINLRKAARARLTRRLRGGTR